MLLHYIISCQFFFSKLQFDSFQTFSSSFLSVSFCLPTRTSLYLLSLYEYFTLLLPLVRDAGHWALIVWTQCGCCGMQPLAVQCVVTGVWLLTPAGRLSVCPFVHQFSDTWPLITLLHPHADIRDQAARFSFLGKVLCSHLSFEGVTYLLCCIYYIGAKLLKYF